MLRYWGTCLSWGRAQPLPTAPWGEWRHRAWSACYLLGEFADDIAAGAVEGGLAAADVIVAASHEEILAALTGNLGSGEYVLVKGSRGMQMEIVAEGVRRAFAPQREKGTVA